MKLTSYWLDTSEPFRSATAGPVQDTCDVAVIGGGLTGSSAALALAKKGAHAWPAIPGHLGPPWFLPLVGAYYRIKDRFQ
jgi:NADPH-dependent 2,4-dienoyl-CoA reductase/sulfur reductase-like enzyme